MVTQSANYTQGMMAPIVGNNGNLQMSSN